MSQDGHGGAGKPGSTSSWSAVGGSGTDPTTRTEAEGATLDMPEGMQTFTSGQVLGERYQILEMLGRGGMGEVWHAFDLKLRVEVALKALRGDLFKSERRLELLRQEVRAAREVVSPNVCRIFDLIEVEGRELVSMEYVDGATLLGVLQERGPLELKEAQDIASQFLAGLEAIHKVGLIHRDIKPENIMLTRAGRVVVMDFGLARQETEGGGTVSGTPAYMAPEQAAGQAVDARADVYAAGVVLAEMVSPEGIKSYESRQSVWEGVRSEPAKLPDSPWAPAIKKAVAKDRAGRYNSAHTLTRALEDVTLRVEGAEDLHPYPGLASFTESDAEYFFGREAEVEQMWRKLERPHLLGIVGPSGAGKTSFIRAGVIPNAGSGWAIATCNPGDDSRRVLTGFRGQTTGVAFSPDGSLAAGAGGTFDEDENVIRVWDVASGEELTVLVPEADLFEWALQFTPGNRLLSSGQDGLRRWNLETGESELLYEGMVKDFSASADGRRALVNAVDDWNFPEGRAVVLDLETGVATPLETHGNRVTAVVLDKAGTIAATGGVDGMIRVGPVTGEEPHLLIGHEDFIFDLAFDPLGRRIASGANDSTARLWPMPDLSKPPLHTLPREELIAKLKTLTNLRVIRDEESASGWKVEIGPFPGWAEVPEW